MEKNATLTVREFLTREIPFGINVKEALDKLILLTLSITPEAIGVGVKVDWDWFVEKTNQLRGHERFLKSFREVLLFINGENSLRVESSHVAVASSYENTLEQIEYIATHIYEALTADGDPDYDNTSASASQVQNIAREVRYLARGNKLGDFLPKALKECQ